MGHNLFNDFYVYSMKFTSMTLEATGSEQPEYFSKISIVLMFYDDIDHFQQDDNRGQSDFERPNIKDFTINQM